MAYQMAQIPVTLSELEGHFCCYDCPDMSHGPSATAELFVFSAVHLVTGKASCPQ